MYNKRKKILLTGGAGYIGSHTAIELIEAGHTVIIVDDLVNSDIEAVRRVEKITNTRISFYEIDVCNKEKLRTVFRVNHIDDVIHFAGLKAVGESVVEPLLYYRTNIDASLSLLEVMAEFGVHKLVFSSSATVYGSASVPYSEEDAVGKDITSPYGQTKYMIEQIIIDAAKANRENEFTMLRYFNPIGAHEWGLIGEDPLGVPNNLMPFIAQVASGRREKLSIYGNDYSTPDGTCLRDYIHVVDLAKAHLMALEKTKQGVRVYNLGSGKSTSVLELVNAFVNATGQNIPYQFAPRRDGDLPAFWANPKKAIEELGWKAEKTIEQACQDSWRWQSQNPNSYGSF